MEHAFSIGVATVVGVEKAVLLKNIMYWTKKNKANKRHFYEGRFWTYNTAEAFAELFPYLNKKSIARWLKELEDVGYLHVGNFNDKNYDRTKRYSVNEKRYIETDKYEDYSSEPISQNEESISQDEETIPDSKPDSKPIKNGGVILEEKHIPFTSCPKVKNKTQAWQQIFQEYFELRIRKKQPITPNILRIILKDFDNYSEDIQILALKKSVISNYVGVFPESVNKNTTTSSGNKNNSGYTPQHTSKKQKTLKEIRAEQTAGLRP